MTLSRDARKAETRAALLRATAKLVAKHGIEATSLDRISAEVGLTKGAVYAHFANKQELVVAAAHAVEAEPRQARMFDVLFDETRPLADRLQEVASLGVEAASTGELGLSGLELALFDLELFTYELRDSDSEFAAITRRAYERMGARLDAVQKQRGEPLTYAGSTVMPVILNLFRGLNLAHALSPDLVPGDVFEDVYAQIGKALTKPARKASGASRPRRRGG